MSLITSGAQLTTFITGLNADLAIDPTLLGVLVETAKTIIEEERPWMVLRKTNTSKTVTTANTWQTAIDLSTITDFSRLDINSDGVAFTLFDGGTRVEHYRLKPFDQRLQFKDVSYSCVFDENAKTLYLNGSVPYNGTLYITYISTSTAIDLTSESAVWTVFPSRFLPVLGFYAVGINKGAVDYDSINRQMLPENRTILMSLKNAMEKWDNDKQLSVMQANDPSELYGYPRSGAIDRYN